MDFEVNKTYISDSFGIIVKVLAIYGDSRNGVECSVIESCNKVYPVMLNLRFMVGSQLAVSLKPFCSTKEEHVYYAIKNEHGLYFAGEGNFTELRNAYLYKSLKWVKEVHEQLDMKTDIVVVRVEEVGVLNV